MGADTTSARTGVDLCQEREWLRGYREGQPKALERVFRAYAPLVYHVLRTGVRGQDGAARIGLSSPDQEDDVVQDTFIRLFSAPVRERYDGIRPFGAYVRVVARSALIDHLRKHGRVTAPLDVDVDPADVANLDGWVPGAPLPDQTVLSLQEQQKARAFLDSLPDADRHLFRARFEQGMTQEQAAATLGLSRQGLRTVENKLRRKITDFLGSLG